LPNIARRKNTSYYETITYNSKKEIKMNAKIKQLFTKENVLRTTKEVGEFVITIVVMTIAIKLASNVVDVAIDGVTNVIKSSK
jgi:hypothetical protein